MTVERLVETLSGVLDARDRRTAPQRQARVLGRNDDGTLQLQRLDEECPERGCATPQAAGEIVERPAAGCWSQEGTTGVALLADRGTARGLVVVRLTPNVFTRGETVTAVAEGLGLGDGVAVDFLLAGETIHPGVTVTEVRAIDGETAEIDLVVAEDAQLVNGAPLAYDRPAEVAP